MLTNTGRQAAPPTLTISIVRLILNALKMKACPGIFAALIVVGCTDSAHEPPTVDPCDSAVPTSGRPGDMLCHGSVPTCETDLDCLAGETCFYPGGPTVGVRICTDFGVEIEYRHNDEEDWRTMEGPETTSPEFTLNYDRVDCSSGMWIEFTAGREPGGGEEMRVRYIDADGAERCEWWVFDQR